MCILSWSPSSLNRKGYSAPDRLHDAVVSTVRRRIAPAWRLPVAKGRSHHEDRRRTRASDGVGVHGIVTVLVDFPEFISPSPSEYSFSDVSLASEES